MLLFYASDAQLDLDAVRATGLSSQAHSPLRLHTSLETATANAEGPVLVVDPTGLPSALPTRKPSGECLEVDHVAPPALENISPYRPPQPVTAGGGYVGCALPNDAALLLIHRRGVWDLPKGHQDPGEDIETCALREVREEVGIDALDLRRSLGTTQHGYPYGDVYAVKTTHWYLMQTPERSFSPERDEGIRRVAWARWSVAQKHIGYGTLRRHMDRVESDVRAALA